MFSWLFLPTGLIASALNFAGTLSPVLVIVIQTVLSGLTWFFRTFWEGLQVVLSNLSTLTVIAVCVGVGGWYAQTWDNPKLLRECEVRIVEVKKKQQQHPKGISEKNTYKPSPSVNPVENWRPW